MNLTCFENANRGSSTLLNQPATDEAHKEQVRRFVESIFTSCGVDFDNPTKEDTLTAMARCKANAERMMGPRGSDIIQHHHDEMMKLVAKLPD